MSEELKIEIIDTDAEQQAWKEERFQQKVRDNQIARAMLLTLFTVFLAAVFTLANQLFDLHQKLSGP